MVLASLEVSRSELGVGRACITCQPLPRRRFTCQGFVGTPAGCGVSLCMGPAGCCPWWVWWPLELFHGDSLGRGTSVGEAIPAHHPSVPWLSLAAPSCPSFLPGPGLKVLPGGQLRLLRAAPEDAGTYLCLARNPSGTAAGRTRLIVQGTAATGAPALPALPSPCAAPLGETRLPSCQRVLLPHPVPPTIAAGPPGLAVPAGLEALLPCAARGVPEPRVSWSREGEPVRAGRATVLPSGELLLRDVRVSAVP